MERDHDAFKTYRKRRPVGESHRSTAINEEGNQLRLSDSCPLCCLPLDGPGDVCISARQEAVRTSRTTNEPVEKMRVVSAMNDPETQPHQLKQQEKNVRFHIVDNEFEPTGGAGDEPLAGDAPLQTEHPEPSKAAKTTMLNHVADHLQFLALLTPRLSNEELTDGRIQAFSSSREDSSDRSPGPRSTLEDEFDLSAGDETGGPRDTTIPICTEISEPGKDIRIPSEVPEEKLRNDDSETSAMDNWAFLSMPSLADTEDDSIVKGMRESRAQLNRTLDAALDRLPDLGLALSRDGHDAWIRMESRLNSAQIRRNEDEPGTFIPLPEQHKAITEEDLRCFFHGLFSSMNFKDHDMLVDFCVEQVWAVQPYPDLHQPKEWRSASRRRLFSMLLIHGRPSEILVFIRQKVSDLSIPIAATTIAHYLPDWRENAVAALIQDQRQFLSDDELDIESGPSPMLQATRDSESCSLKTGSEISAQVINMPVDHGPSKPTSQFRPSSRGEYQVAIFAASGLEVAAAASLLDTRWYESSNHEARDDTTTYVLGSMSGCNVVITCVGHESPAKAATNCSAGFPNIRLALIAGVCHAVPFYRSGSNEINEIILGDVIISDEVVQVRLGRHHSVSSYQKIKSDTLGGFESDISGLLSDANDSTRNKGLHNRITAYLDELRENPKLGAEYPGAQHDSLYGPTYQPLEGRKRLEKIGYHGELVPRHRLDQDSPDPLAHVGLIASSNILLSGEFAEEIVEKHETIAFEMGNPSEMESSQLRHVFPSFLMVMGVRDYTNSRHETGVWRRYAAAVAAACTKALLDYWKPSQQGKTPDKKQPRTWFVVPQARNPQFVGRKATLKKLQRRSFNSAFRARPLLFGLGGIGKTQIALEHAYWLKEARKDASVFWVDASNAARFHESYHRIAEACGIPGHKDPEADILRSVRTWLESVASGRWFMVIDHVDDAALFSSQGLLRPYIPKCPHGSFIVTTRNKRAAFWLDQRNSPVKVDAMDESESLQLLSGRIEQSEVSLKQLSALACRLGYVPLALAQAASYTTTNEISANAANAVNDYLEISDIVILGGGNRDNVSFGTHATPLKNVWGVSFTQVQQQDSFAANLLGLMAFLDPQSIATEILSQFQRLEDQVGGRGNVAEAVDLLQAYSFVGKNKDNTLNTHRLVQHLTREWLGDQGLKPHFAGRAILALSEAYPSSSHENWAVCRAYLPHVYEILQHEGTGSRDESIRKALLLGKASSYLLRQGQFDEAERLQLQTIELRRSVLGNDDLLTLGGMAVLGSTLMHQGKLEEAEELWLNVLARLQEVLEEEHVYTLNVMSNLVFVYEAQGRLGEAEQLGTHVTKTLEERLGPGNLDTLSSLSRLASVYRAQGRVDEAENLGTRAMETYERVLGTHHPRTLSSMSYIASIHHCQGRLEEAENLEVRVLEHRKRVLGPHHPDTLVSMGDLTKMYEDQGRVMEAEALEAELREIQTLARIPTDIEERFAAG